MSLTKGTVQFTYIPYPKGTCYLSTILDAYTRQILAYVLSDSLELDFVLGTVQQLVQAHGIDLQMETLIHSGSRLPLHEHSFQRTCKEQETAAVDVAEGKLLG